MKTHYVDMSVSHQEQLRSLFDLVNSVRFNHNERLAPVLHSFEPTRDLKIPNCEELILNNRCTLNSSVVNFSLTPVRKMLLKGFRPNIEEIFEYVECKWEQHHNPEVHCLNYEDGVQKLFSLLQENVIFIWRPPVRQRGTDMLLSLTVYLYRWLPEAQAFKRLGSMDGYGRAKREVKYDILTDLATRKDHVLPD